MKKHAADNPKLAATQERFMQFYSIFAVIDVILNHK